MSPALPPTLAVHRIPLYNTARLKDEEVIAAFAARMPVLERILADIADEKSQSRAQHHLIVGQRGMGKTMLLARLAAGLRSGTLAERFVPLVFAVDQYSVDRLSKFWMNCLDSLADARERAGYEAEAKAIDQTVRRLESKLGQATKDDTELAHETLEAFLAAAKAAGRRPVLLVDNVQIVFERLNSPQQHTLRELLMRPGSPILIGASPSPPPESQDYGAAFYDQFKVHYLRPLSLEEMRSLLLHLAKISGRDDVAQRVVQQPERLAVLRQLTGGNPRTTLMLFFLYAEDFSPTVFGDLENLLDRVTPLYKARFEELPQQQQVVASAIANHWDPIISRQLCEATGLAPSQVSPQLDRLEKTGFIEKVELFEKSSSGFQIAERFFNVWYLMRSGSRRQRRQVEFLTRFLQAFYEVGDRQRLARSVLCERDLSPDRLTFSLALAGTMDTPQSKEELERHAHLDALRQAATDARKRLDEILDLSALPPATVAFDQLRKKLLSLIPVNQGFDADAVVTEILSDRKMFQSRERERLAARAAPLHKAEVEALLKSVRSNREVDNTRYSEAASSWFSARLASGQLRSPDDLADWDRAFQQVEERKDAVQLIVDTVPPIIAGQLPENTIGKISRCLTPSATALAWEWCNWGYNLHITLKRYSDAETAYRRA
ncbi:MAG: hypothetical protein JWN70_7039, partial [Planctomycetaceae bacterium]|nr:hypothetical protein [Planctomycetaceae bacterium]